LSIDQSDLIALLDPRPHTSVLAGKMDSDLVKRIIQDRELDFVHGSIRALPARLEAIRRYSTHKKVSPQEIENWIEPFVPNQ